MHDIPKVSILIPVKDEEKFIIQSIDSIINQTYKNIEIIIVDDGSIDNTLEKLEKYKHIDNIKIIPTNGIGKNPAFNIAFKNSTGEYICYFAGDDIMMTHSVEARLHEMFKYRNNEILLLSKLETISENKKFNGQILPKIKTEGSRSGGSMMFTRELIEGILPLPEFLPNEDLWSFIYCDIFDIKIIHLPNITYWLRFHENNSYSSFSSYQDRTEAIHKREIAYGVFLEKYRNKLSVEKINYLSNKNCLENLRYNKNTWAIIFMKNLRYSDKLRGIFYSSEFLYFIRVRLNFLFSGRM
jgi:glycosyltransferase involved in cell wall biosynthesis